MMRIGSLCSGYGGLDGAVRMVLGGEVAWLADNDPDAAKVLAYRYPDVPNLGDITATDWSSVEPVDILTAGFPCQDVSCAGARKGLRAGTRTGVWTHVAEAIAALRPSLVVLENVRGLLSAGADSDMELCPWCLGESGAEHALRACGAVLGDLSDLLYDTAGAVVSAADAGAPHRRERVFILAWPAADARGERWNGRPGFIGAGRPQAFGDEARDHSFDSSGALAEDANSTTRGQRRLAAPGQAPGGRPRSDARGSGGAPAAHSEGYRRDEGRAEPAWLLRGPDAALGGDGTAADANDGQPHQPEGPDRAADERAAAGRPVLRVGGRTPADADSSGRGPDERDLSEREPNTDRLPPADAERCGRDGWPQDPQRGQERGAAARRDSDAPADADSDGLARSAERDSEPQRAQAGREQRRVDPQRRVLDWGPYEAAISRWEAVVGRPAPRPTEPGRTGERLSPRFVEWMQGLPEGWVTDVPGLSRNAQLKALGNGVVPAQAELALRLLLDRAGFTGSEAAA